ncbi:39460_t:CDS:2 [Gigaspora margarita]|uniref:39460_t:CDS:1 n=1 Tax=Gigaspora margarita TaxID=4874 RepID=A0ABN7VR08_GIGMA|nr:39460_t:CDS:2 [Gigaspora margarita]
MPSTITVICYITDHRETITSKGLTVAKAAGTLRLRNNESLLTIHLVGFYSHNEIQGPSLPSFSTEDVLMVTGNELPASPLLINMTAVALELSRNDPDHDIISLSVEMKDFVNQENTKLKFECYHARSAQHLTPTTTTLKESNEPTANKSNTEKVARTIASRVKNTRRKKAPATRAPYLKLKDRPKVTDLAKSALSQDQNIDYPDPSIP